MNLCLDTNAYTAFKRGHLPLCNLLESADQIFVPSIVLGELYAGFFQGKKSRQNRTELQQFIESPGVSIIDISSSVAERYGRLIQILRENGKPIPTNDIWIAAATLDTGSRLVSYDKHFERVPGILVYSP